MRNATAAPQIRRTVASAVRAELARAGVSQATAAAWIGVTQPAMSARLHARVPFTVDELHAMAEGLGLPVETLLASNVTPFRRVGDPAGALTPANSPKRLVTREYRDIVTPYLKAVA